MDVAQDVTITEEDCGTIMGLEVGALKEGEDVIEPLGEPSAGNVAARDIGGPAAIARSGRPAVPGDACPPVAKEQRFLITHGTQDPLIPCDKDRQQMEGLRLAGIRLDWREFDKAHTIAGEVELKVIRDFVMSCYPK